jgi:hypothetical protein
MLKKDLAALLEISPAMVSRLAKQGMPVDTLERAKRWRKRRLEPSRIKGSRFDPSAPPVVVKPEAPPVALVIVARVAAVANAALTTSTDFEHDLADLLAPLRDVLRQLPDNARPRMPLRVWLALVDWVLNEKSALRHATDLDSVLDPDEFAVRTMAQSPGVIWLELACDYRGFSITGLPDVDFDFSDGQVSGER